MFFALSTLLAIFHLIFAEDTTESTILAANIYDDVMLEQILNRLDLLQATMDSQNINMDQQFTNQRNEFKIALDQLKNEFEKNLDQHQNKFKIDMDQQFTEQSNAFKNDLDRQFAKQQNDFKEDMDRQFTKQQNESKKDIDSQFTKQKNEFKNDIDQQSTKQKNEFKIDMDRQFEKLQTEFKKYIDPQLIHQQNDFKKDMEQQFSKQLTEFKNDMDSQFTKQQSEFRKICEDLVPLPENCNEALEKSGKSGVYKIQIPNSELEPFPVYCLSHLSTAWMVVQRRQDGSIDFYRNWTDYKSGFGDLKGEFFIGLNKLHELTQSTLHELWIQMEDFEGSKRWAKYSSFSIGGNNDGYILKTLGDYTGDAGDSMWKHVGKKWTTKDVDNANNPRKGAENCAITYKGAWWYHDCFSSHLNGEYLRGAYPKGKYGDGIIWNTWHGPKYSLKYVHMAIRPVH